MRQVRRLQEVAAYDVALGPPRSRDRIGHHKIRIAEILRDRFAATAAAEPEALAHHFAQAGMTDAAIEWWGKAGDQALRRSAFQEAVTVLSLPPRRGDGAVSVRFRHPMLPHPTVAGSALGATHFRGHIHVHCRYGPVTCNLPEGDLVDRLQDLGFPATLLSELRGS